MANADGRYGVPLPPFADLIESGRVCALNFPVVANPGLARTIGTLMKQDFQRAVLSRIPRMAQDPAAPLAPRPVPLRRVPRLRDGGGERPDRGREVLRALAPGAVHPHRRDPESELAAVRAARGVLAHACCRRFARRIFLALSDDFSARVASDLCGQDEQLKPQYTISENAQDAGVSLLAGRTTVAPRHDHREQELPGQSATRVRAQDVRRTQERPGDRAGLRRAQSAAADVLLPQAPLPGPERDLLQSAGPRSPVMSFEVILPFLRPIEPLILDPEVTEIMVNGSGRVFIEREGRL